MSEPAAASALPSVPRGVLLVLGLLALSLLLYAGVLAGPAIWDDHFSVVGQSFLRDWRNLGALFSREFLTSPPPIPNTARPLWMASVLADRFLFGDAFLGLRLSNQLWHVLGAALLAALAWEVSGSRAAAAASGLLFVCHPAHTETVNIITFRGDMIAVSAICLGLILLLRGRRAEKPGPCLAGSAACFAAALLAKESGAAFPMLAGLALLLPGPSLRERLGRGAPAFAAALLVILGLYLAYRAPRSGYRYKGASDEMTRIWRQAGGTGGEAESALPEPPSWWTEFSDGGVRLRSTLTVHARAFAMMFWPWPLQGDYAPRIVRGWGDPGPWLGLACWLTLLGAALALRESAPLAALGLGWLPLAYLPTSGLILIRNLEADRYLFIPSAGVCLAAAALLARPALPAAGRRASAALVLALAANWSLLTVARNRDYRDDVAFFQHAVDVDPGVPRARLNLALALHAHGRDDEADGHFRAALALSPSERARRAYEGFLRDTGRSQPPAGGGRGR